MRRPPGQASKSQAFKLLILGNGDLFHLVPPKELRCGLGFFILIINDLKPAGSSTWKYVDDTTLAEVVPKGSRSAIQSAVTAVELWSANNNLLLNPNRCKEFIINFKRTKARLS